jgi:hypothetical protein
MFFSQISLIHFEPPFAFHDRHLMENNFDRPHLLIKILNKGANILKKFGLLSFSLSPEKIIESVQRKTGLTDFGSESYLDNLKKFLSCFDDASNFNYTGRMLLNIESVELSLKRLLYLEKDFQKHPEILKIPLERPFIILGFPRTGTTLLQNLLCLHTGCRWIRKWELLTPFPSKRSDWGGANDYRPTFYKDKIEPQIRKLAPKMDTIHSLDSPKECAELLMTTFMAHEMLGFYYDVKKYREWLGTISEEETRSSYHFYKRQLQHMSWYQPGSHWVLKSIDHLVNLAHLLEIFPDAQIIHLHRDPLKVVPSYSSLVYYIQSQYQITKDVSPEKTGQHTLSTLSRWGEKGMAFRKKNHPSPNFIDIQYLELVKDPIGVVKNIYEHFDTQFPGDMESKLTDWLDKNHGKNRLKHKYSPDKFGLTVEKIDREFEDYCNYFQVLLER